MLHIGNIIPSGSATEKRLVPMDCQHLQRLLDPTLPHFSRFISVWAIKWKVHDTSRATMFNVWPHLYWSVTSSYHYFPINLTRDPFIRLLLNFTSSCHRHSCTCERVSCQRCARILTSSARLAIRERRVTRVFCSLATRGAGVHDLRASVKGREGRRVFVVAPVLPGMWYNDDVKCG